MTVQLTGFLENKAKTRSSPIYTLSNGKMSVSVLAYGGYITSLLVPDRYGNTADISLGFPDLDSYEATSFAPCGIVGRYANRINNGSFMMNGKNISVTQNDGCHHLHGGKKGFHRFQWNPIIESDNAGHAYLKLNRTSPHKEEGYPGNLTVSVRFSLTLQNELCIHFLAVSDKDTVCNLSNHMALNLNSCRSDTCLDHRLNIYADSFSPANADGIPYGDVLPVDGTNLDFRKGRLLADQITLPSRHTEPFGGYDHNWFLRKADGLKPCLTLSHPDSGRAVECFTTMPCVHVYTANSLSGNETGKYHTPYGKHCAFFMETQFAPDSVNHPEWEQPFLKAGELYDHTTVYRFCTE